MFALFDLVRDVISFPWKDLFTANLPASCVICVSVNSPTILRALQQNARKGHVKNVYMSRNTKRSKTSLGAQEPPATVGKFHQMQVTPRGAVRTEEF